MTKADVIYSLRQNNRLSLQKIGDEVGLTRERVRQVLDKYEKKVVVLCGVCRQELLPHRIKHGFCNACADELGKTKLCRKCWKPFVRTIGFVAYCEDCRFETRPCSWCATPVTLNRGKKSNRFGNKRWFCNRSCCGKWLGKNMGRNKHKGVVS